MWGRFVLPSWALCFWLPPPPRGVVGSPSDLTREGTARHQTQHTALWDGGVCCYDTTLLAIYWAYGRYDTAMRTIETLESEVLKMKLRMDSMFTHDQLNKRIKVSCCMSYDTSHALWYMHAS